jgi:hypothetical protein
MVRAGKQHRRVHFERREHRQRGGNIAGGGGVIVIRRHYARVFLSLSFCLGNEIYFNELFKRKSRCLGFWYFCVFSNDFSGKRETNKQTFFDFIVSA